MLAKMCLFFVIAGLVCLCTGGGGGGGGCMAQQGFMCGQVGPACGVLLSSTGLILTSDSVKHSK